MLSDVPYNLLFVKLEGSLSSMSTNPVKDTPRVCLFSCIKRIVWVYIRGHLPELLLVPSSLGWATADPRLHGRPSSTSRPTFPQPQKHKAGRCRKSLVSEPDFTEEVKTVQCIFNPPVHFQTIAERKPQYNTQKTMHPTIGL